MCPSDKLTAGKDRQILRNMKRTFRAIAVFCYLFNSIGYFIIGNWQAGLGWICAFIYALIYAVDQDQGYEI